MKKSIYIAMLVTALSIFGLGVSAVNGEEAKASTVCDQLNYQIYLVNHQLAPLLAMQNDALIYYRRSSDRYVLDIVNWKASVRIKTVSRLNYYKKVNGCQ